MVVKLTMSLNRMVTYKAESLQQVRCGHHHMPVLSVGVYAAAHSIATVTPHASMTILRNELPTAHAHLFVLLCNHPAARLESLND